ncbi:MAG: DUF6873 family GME fold protein [Bacteroidota bacterium]
MYSPIFRIMWIIVDQGLPEKIKHNLSQIGTLLQLHSKDIVYNQISGHPDIFFCQTPQGLIAAPNTPKYFLNTLIENKVPFSFGYKPLGGEFPETVYYNAVSTEKYLIHNVKYTDKKILEASESKTTIAVEQAYTRCNLMALSETHFITSDKSIELTLLKNELKVCYVHPKQILLNGFSNGFFGGCCGLYQNQLFLNGSIKHLSEIKPLIKFIRSANVRLVELYDGPLLDSGSIFFVNQ